MRLELTESERSTLIDVIYHQVAMLTARMLKQKGDELHKTRVERANLKAIMEKLYSR